jgi:REP element-mobilizing transposase RayT
MYFLCMNEQLPLPPTSFGLKQLPATDPARAAPPKDWPHAPVHRLTENGVYFVTSGTLHKKHLFDTPAKRELLEGLLLSLAKERRWQLEAWVVLANHYHFVARVQPDPVSMRDFVRELHSRSAIRSKSARRQRRMAVWHKFWDTRLTYQSMSVVTSVPAWRLRASLQARKEMEQWPKTQFCAPISASGFVKERGMFPRHAGRR